MEGSLLSKIFVTLMDRSLVIMEGSLLSRNFVTSMDGSLVIIEVEYCRDFCYYNVW